ITPSLDGLGAPVDCLGHGERIDGGPEQVPPHQSSNIVIHHSLAIASVMPTAASQARRDGLVIDGSGRNSRWSSGARTRPGRRMFGARTRDRSCPIAHLRLVIT